MIKIIRDRISLGGLKEEWNNLAKIFASPLLCHEWLASCAEAFHQDNDLRIVIVRSNGKIDAIAPMVVIKKRGVEYLEFLGSSFLYEPCNLIYRNHESLRILLNQMIKLGHPIYLNRIPSDSPIINLLSDFPRSKGILIKRTSSGSAFVPIEASWEEYTKIFSSKRRYDLKRKKRMAKKIDNVKFKIFCPPLEELENYLKIAFKIEAAGWKRREGSALLIKERLKNFFRIHSFLTCTHKSLRLCFLYIGEIAVAMMIGLEYKKKFWLLKNGYDEKFSKCSPGILLVHETIRYAFDHGLKSFEFLGSDEPYVRIWANNNFREYSSLGFYPINFSGIIGFGADAGNYIFRKLT